MAELRPGAVVVVPFPYSDLSRAKLRPALVLAIIAYGDLLVCQITSKTYANNQVIALSNRDFSQGNLPATSYIRPDKLATIHRNQSLGIAAYIKQEVLSSVINSTCAIIKRGSA